MKKINFLFGIHCHQPIGNFESVIEENYQKAYLPFVKLISQYPKIKFSFHFSGILYDYFLEKHREFIELLKVLVKRGQAEILTGGYYEPILSIIPEKDALGQIALANEIIRDRLHAAPRGLWLTERIWEPKLPIILSQAGIEYAIVDDYHFTCAGFNEEETLGYYVTEEQGKTVNLFPISKKMRYLIPFKLPEEVISYLSSVAAEAGDRAVVAVGDGEKLGGWPETHKWVYEEGYLKKLFDLLEENSDWINAITFSEYLDNFPPKGRVYLPTASYFEMMDWSLPAPAAKKLHKVMDELGKWPQKKELLRFLRGGFFRNFFIKYEEANNMHKKMLHVSQKLGALTKKKTLFGREGEEDRRLKEAALELYKGQCNCAYWHGIFGGVYLDFLRKAIYEHLIAAENLVDQYIKGKNNFIELSHTDFDKDGREELLITSNVLNLYLSPHKGGTIFELDYRPKKINLLNTLTRKEEASHRKVIEGAAKKEGEIASIHEKTTFKEKGLENLLHYDPYRRSCLVDHFLDANTDLKQFFASDYKEMGDFIEQPYQVLPRRKGKEIEVVCKRKGETLPVTVTKVVTVYAGQSMINIDYEAVNNLDENLEVVFAPEFNLSFLRGGENDFYLRLNKTKTLPARDFSLLDVEEIRKLAIVDDRTGFSVSLEANSGYNLWFFKLFTVSQSEAGFEKNFQGLVIVPRWKLCLKPGEKWSEKLVLKMEE